MRARNALAVIAVALAVLVAAGVEARATQVILLRGLADVFSTGMDILAEKLTQRGIKASVASRTSAPSIANELAAAYKSGARSPIVLVGHSFGADAAVEIAQQLNAAKVPVALLVTFGPGGSLPVPANVSSAVNYHMTSAFWRGKLVPGPGFRGSISNINLDNAADVTHFNMEKSDRLHTEVIGKIMAVGGRRK